TSARVMQPSLGSKSIEDIPVCVYSHNAPLIKFFTDFRITLAVNFITGKSPDMRAQSASVQNILLVFDLDIFLPGFDHRAVCIGPCQTVVWIRMIWTILQFAGNLKGRCRGSRRCVRTKKLAEPEV